MSSGVPSFKVENTDAPIKPEPLDDASSPIASDIDGEGGGYMDDTEVDDPELDLKSARQPLWITRVPHYMWDMLAQAKDDEEIELGTIRVEGTIEKPTRVSLMLNSLPRFAGVEKEYRLDQPVAPLRKKKDKPRTMVFSEKDKAGYKPKTWAWDDLDEDGNPGQGRSYLYEAQRREERKKESKGRYTPYAKRPIPKITSITGTVVQEFDLKPVSNDEHAKFEAKRRETMLAGSIKMASKDSRESLSFIRDSAPRHAATVLTAGEKATMHRQQQQKKQARKDDRTTRMEKNELIEALLRRFREFRFYGLRTLRTQLKQPEQWIKENLEEIAIMHKAGDFNGKWELRDEYKNQDESLMNAAGEAKGEDSDIDMLKSEGDDDEEFEDV